MSPYTVETRELEELRRKYSFAAALVGDQKNEIKRLDEALLNSKRECVGLITTIIAAAALAPHGSAVKKCLDEALNGQAERCDAQSPCISSNCTS